MSGEPAPNAGTSFSHGVGGRDFGLAKGRIVLVITGVGFVDDLCRHPIEHHFARCGAFKLA
jgi:hypothetical protein